MRRGALSACDLEPFPAPGEDGVSTTLAVSVSAPLITSSTAAGRITSPARDRPRRQHRRQPLFVPPDDIHLSPPAIDAGACTSCANDRLRSRNPSAILPEPRDDLLREQLDRPHHLVVRNPIRLH